MTRNQKKVSRDNVMMRQEPSSTGYVWQKYCDWSDHAMVQILDGGVDVIYFRYADVLLMHAEDIARNERGCRFF